MILVVCEHGQQFNMLPSASVLKGSTELVMYFNKVCRKQIYNTHTHARMRAQVGLVNDFFLSFRQTTGSKSPCGEASGSLFRKYKGEVSCSSRFCVCVCVCAHVCVNVCEIFCFVKLNGCEDVGLLM